MGDSKTTQEFRESLLEEVTQTHTSVDLLRQDFNEFKSGKNCPRGAAHAARIDLLEASDSRQWDAIDGAPTRRDTNGNSLTFGKLKVAGWPAVIVAIFLGFWLLREYQNSKVIEQVKQVSHQEIVKLAKVLTPAVPVPVTP